MYEQLYLLELRQRQQPDRLAILLAQDAMVDLWQLPAINRWLGKALSRVAALKPARANDRPGQAFSSARAEPAG